MSCETKKIANPGPLGLLGFGMTTVLLNLHNAGFLPLSIVIVAMEGYNFILSAVRLYKRIKFRIYIVKSVVLPVLSALISAYLSKRLFRISGETSLPVWLFLRVLFAAAVFVCAYTLLKSFYELFEAKINERKLKLT